MRYFFSSEDPDSHFLNIRVEADVHREGSVIFTCPSWRPGRYELADFAKNIGRIHFEDELGNELQSVKIAKDRWEVESEGSAKVIAVYTYYAAEINAGSSYVDRHQMYVNPVNCCLYVEELFEEEVALEINWSGTFQVAIGLYAHDGVFQASGIDELLDSPFIVSDQLKHHAFEQEDTNYHIWFYGAEDPPMDKIEKDFRKFTRAQTDMLGAFPVKDYHYLIQILDHKGYHGVEHSASTVISIGPEEDVFNDEVWYPELLGVSSHELFHTWNVKRIRPADMWPYDFTKENYTRMGYVTEGYTTYYGDLFLYRSGCFDDALFFQQLDKFLARHFNNPGRHNYSVSESSFDTWLDGYVKGVPGRKTSIYVEGALCAFMMDVAIRRASGNVSSLDTVVKWMLDTYYSKGQGVDEQGLIGYLRTYGEHAEAVLNNHVYGTAGYLEPLQEAFGYLGMELSADEPKSDWHAWAGVILDPVNGTTVDTVLTDSPGAVVGLQRGCKVLTVNGVEFEKDMNLFGEGSKALVEIKEKFAPKRSVELLKPGSICAYEYHVKKNDSADEEARKAFQEWAHRPF